MLVLGLKPPQDGTVEQIVIGDSVRLHVVRVGCQETRIGIEAPRKIRIRRERVAFPRPSSKASLVKG